MMDRIAQAPNVSVRDLEDPAFLEFVKLRFPDEHVIADPEDYHPRVINPTLEECADAMKRAQARKLLRLCREWKSNLRAFG